MGNHVFNEKNKNKKAKAKTKNKQKNQQKTPESMPQDPLLIYKDGVVKGAST